MSDISKPAQDADWVRIKAQMEEVRSQQEQDLKAKRSELLLSLRKSKVAEITAVYNGYADSGNVEELNLEPSVQLPSDLDERLRDFFWDLAYHLHPGFEINDGGRGEICWDIGADRIDVDHSEFFTSSNEYLHEDV